MTRNKFLLPLIMIVGLSSTSVFAQRAVLTAGSKTSNSTGSVTYSIGQIAYKGFGNNTGSVAQGVLQTSVLVTALNDQYTSEISCDVFPNPTPTDVVVKIDHRSFENLSVQLLDLNGKVVHYQKINDKETIVPTQSLIPAAYLLRISDRDQELKSFKIIKY